MIKMLAIFRNPYIAIVLAVVAVMLLLIIVNMPKPTATASGTCSMSCTTKTVNVDYVESLEAAAVCGSGCLIESVHESITTTGYDIVCKCCQCEGSYSGDIVTPQCNYQIPFLNEIAAMLGVCTL